MKRTIPYDHATGIDSTDLSDFTSFTGELSQDSEKEFPAYSELLEWKPEHINVRMSIVFPVYETFLGNITDSTAYRNLSDSVFSSYSLDYLRKKPFLQIMLIPFRRNPENGRIERLKNFVIRLEDAGSPQAETISGKKSVVFPNSVLATGKWYKIKVPSSGIYKLSYDQINSMAVGNPENIRIYGEGGEVLPEDCRKGEKDDLLPIQIYMNKGNDGVFNAGDYILFYSKGSVKWTYDNTFGMFRHQMNPYSDFSYYFVTSGSEPDLPVTEPEPLSAPDKFSDSYD
jgi:hypothetical protein